jgi:quaternary ammonium compound-resistance protein SugE
MTWILLFIAGLFECAWAIGMKYSEGFTKGIPSLITILCMLISTGLLAYCVKHLPVGIAYAIWTGIGALGTAVLGIVLFKESADFWKIFFIFVIITGLVGLGISSKV